LLGCGWPNNKTYKWQDSKYLINYGLENYEFHTINNTPIKIRDVWVNKATRDNNRGTLLVDTKIIGNEYNMLLSKEDVVTYAVDLNTNLEAPVDVGKEIGMIKYYVNDELVYIEKIITVNGADSYDFWWCLKKYLLCFIYNNII
jgi:serine-type D-Ala-D-Ala carboxypeptidase (penicillin-binding protein 5/6)